MNERQTALGNKEQTVGRVEGGGVKESHTKSKLASCVDRKERNFSHLSSSIIKTYRQEGKVTKREKATFFN